MPREESTSERPNSRPTGNPEWDHAWDLVCRLGATRGRLSTDVAADQGVTAAAPVPAPPVNEETLDPDELARAIADIEQASAALRRAEPALETANDRPAPSMQVSGPGSVWVLIGVLWVSTVVVTAGVIFTIASLVG